ncbi:MAG: STAS-like domain-containing protein [Ignavibacteria bacterium]|nr:STAS-like domain-containing protein [Ignavibacteria bacterium]
MEKINIVDLIGATSLMSAEKGIQVFELVFEALKSSSTVVLNFDGYKYISSSFCNSLFGKLAIEKKWTVKELFAKIKIEGMDPDDLDEVELSIINANNRTYLMHKGIDPAVFYTSI